MSGRALAPLETVAWPLFVQWQTLLGRPVNRYEFVVWLCGHAQLYAAHFFVYEIRMRVMQDLANEIADATRPNVEAVACIHS